MIYGWKLEENPKDRSVKIVIYAERKIVKEFNTDIHIFDLYQIAQLAIKELMIEDEKLKQLGQ